ncbi:MAG: S41 family peptidase [Bacteroidales bacterium]|nr:S41 family peptidase [Bacteroidales bacterium]
MMKLRYLIVAAVIAATPFSAIFAQSKEFKAGKSLEVQSRILRVLDAFYVDSVDVEKLVNTGINAMLRTLDPYTEFIPEENETDIDMLTTGSYGGVGSVIQKTPAGGILISEPYENTPSAKMGLQPGDTILEIDGVSALDLEVSQASERMKGEPGSELKLKVKKGRSGQIEDVVLVRERIHVSDVVYYGMVQDTIGYIQIGGFTLYGSRDVRKAFEEMKGNGKMKRLILDLRGNGGGLMSEAVDIVSLFVPKGTLVVSQKGKGPGMNEEFRTTTDPIDTDIPIMVLVNSGSASSSEIVAGALQDLDRAVIAGVRTFGKGLVQSIRSVGYDNSLKLTIAKYYTPSGRCVQAIDYSNRNEDGSVGYVADSLKKEFKTAAGRSVYDGGGITPDLKVETEYYSRPMVALIYSNLINEFAIDYFKKNLQIAPAGEFSLTDEEFDQFVAFASDKDFDHRSESQIEMERVVKAAKRENLYDLNVEVIEKLLDEVTLTKEEFLRHHKKHIKEALEQEICTKYYFQRGGAENILRNNDQMFKAIELWDDTILLPRQENGKN